MLLVEQMGSKEALEVVKKVFYDHMHERPSSHMVTFFAGEMNYAFYHFEDSPYNHSWLGYLITQNSYPMQYEKCAPPERKFPLKVDYTMRLNNYEILTPHKTEKMSKNNSKLQHSIRL